ncbi:exodeoxyribonuclease V subunit gamma [Marinomonas ostreistagni]|uniref:exodeoxyribonuclease V subunit gamma n=1 Tax=Marinomonas ostreistagni TaxID=359209 RepID=UPI0019522A27|nr:exodeoxyribonuclease V subunit gamma [Marinomonas ostreistagni]MBM6550517.1 exodeoxyribonuclease V subunit gamma [Marinomonas ostreistagni]
MEHWPTGLMVIQGNRLESLKEVLVEWVKRYPLKPLETDKFLVQSNGIAQWLQQALAQDERDGGVGIATSIDVSLPGRFVWEAYRAAFWELDTQSPFDLKPMTWRLFRLLSQVAQCDHDGHYDALLHFMATGKDPEHRRYVLAERIAKLFDQYQVYRADWLQAWQDGLDVMPSRDESASAQTKPVPEEQLWQPMLWRFLVHDVEQDPQFAKGKRQVVNRSQIHQDFIEYCRNHGSLEGLPRRVVVFGISSLPNQILEVFHAIAPFTQILLFTMNPSEYYWGDLIEGRQLLRQAQSRRPLREGRTQKDISLDEAHLYGNPLLASWGKLGRDYLHSLDEQDEPQVYQPFFVDSKIDLFESPGETTLLQQLQDDIFQLRSIDDCKALARLIDVSRDDSLRFLETHSRQREIEVLHDLLLNEFEQAAQQGQPLAPRDILIMAPDINVYVPHIEAVFGRFAKYGEHADARFLPFHIADQSARQQHPIVAAFESLLAITHSRFEATDLLSWLDIPALRNAYQLSEGDVVTLKHWIEQANIRWGLDKEQRRGLGLTYPSEQNTWLFGLKRMLLGYSVGNGEIWRDVLPYGDIGGLEARLLGQMHRLVDDIQAVWHAFSTPKVLLDWSQSLQQCLQTFFVASDDHEQRVLSRIEEQIELLEEYVHGSGIEAEQVAIDVVQEALLGQMDEPALSQKFLLGSVNFATLMPMRAIPFKQVYLIGMNDGDYPQISTPMDFDLMVGDYRPGDRSRREDARYLFLEAVLSARDKLVISWQGRSAKDNSEQPPSVLVGQLRDYVAKAWPQVELLEQLTQDYPMQPFSRQYFVEPAKLFTYQQEWEHSAQDQANDVEQTLPPWAPDAPLTARKLTALFRSPVDALFAQRLDIHRPNEIEETKVVENFVSTGLDVWQVHDTLLQFAKRQQPSADAWDQQVEQELARQVAAGELQEGAFAAIRRENLFPETVKHLYFAWRQEIDRLTPKPNTLRQFEVLLDAQTGLTYADDLDRLYYSPSSGETVQFILQTSNVYSESRIESEQFPRDITANKVDAKVRWHNVVHGWVRHVIANVAHQGGIATQIMSPNGDLRFAPLVYTEAQRYLEQLTRTWLNAMQHLLCFGINGAMAYLIQGRSKKSDIDRMLERYSDADLASSGSHYARQYFTPPLADDTVAAFEALIPILCQPMLDALKEG